MLTDKTLRFIIKPLVFVLCLIPSLCLFGGVSPMISALIPLKNQTVFFGDWALRFLLIALTVTPVRILTNWAGAIRFRRMLGLFAFAYVVLHLSSYVVLDQFFDWSAIWKDIIKRWYITVGMMGGILLLPLAITSTKGWIKRIGGKTWRKLHKLVYPAAILGVFHFYMMLKADFREPFLYAVILSVLFGIRLYDANRKRKPRTT